MAFWISQERRSVSPRWSSGTRKHIIKNYFYRTTAALQEVDRQLQAEKSKTATLETQVAALLARVTALENA